MECDAEWTLRLRRYELALPHAVVPHAHLVRVRVGVRVKVRGRDRGRGRGRGRARARVRVRGSPTRAPGEG